MRLHYRLNHHEISRIIIFDENNRKKLNIHALTHELSRIIKFTEN